MQARVSCVDLSCPCINTSEIPRIIARSLQLRRRASPSSRLLDWRRERARDGAERRLGKAHPVRCGLAQAEAHRVAAGQRRALAVRVGDGEVGEGGVEEGGDGLAGTGKGSGLWFFFPGVRGERDESERGAG